LVTFSTVRFFTDTNTLRGYFSTPLIHMAQRLVFIIAIVHMFLYNMSNCLNTIYMVSSLSGKHIAPGNKFQKLISYLGDETSVQKDSFCCALGFITIEATEYSCGGYSSMRPLTLITLPYRTRFPSTGFRCLQVSFLHWIHSLSKN
jgi:hypothetical protein